ncbi:methionine--tRNA ligase [Massilimaliae timonensis]|uniref:Methionine--tRNA ligase n=1 Tax=Massiliimalia timonensis TaxID=1987501 RepID=A0A8J6P5X7_9FIRM|nr:methionine--tRNA ligase [Massiliimalia timonensis]MBC8609750.1 methionine--tRNA ligase [Massiliimalia timonensis]
MKEKFYLTTAIAYTSRKPHIGNSYEIVLTDAIARFKRLIGNDVFFLTGTDEHGQKIEEIAKEMGITPKAYVDQIAGEIRKIWDLMDCSYDKFIRTTDDYHEAVVKKIFKKLYDQGDIYKSEYEGWYCTPCESFWTETQLADGCCPDCGRPVKKTKEEAYFFKMSKYQDRLMQYIEEHTTFIQPESRKREMVNNFLKPGLQDLCVSRTSFSWGIPVDFDPKHVIYVWIDALTNYITALGYDPDGSSELFQKYWPADVHIIGKDILRFHTIYWPIMLMALDIPLPKQVFGHPWLLSGNDKMSKSKGNVMYADDLARHFGVDGVRYYLLKEMPYAQDGTITYENIIARYNSDLANTLGNLVNRTVAMSNKYFDGAVKNTSVSEPVDEELANACLTAVKEYTDLMNQFRVADALEVIMNVARRSNKYIDETAPWTLAKEESNRPRLQTVLYNLLESIRFIGVMISPFLPKTSEKIFEQIKTDITCYDSLNAFGKLKEGTVGTAVPLFARIDEAKKLEELEAEIAKAQAADAPKEKESKDQPEGVMIGIEDFAKVELKAAKVLSCEPVKKSDKLLCLQLDDGTGTPRQVVSGIAAWYRPEDLVGKTIIVVANLKPAKLRGVLSNGMILAADCDDAAKVLFLDDSIPAGAKIR